MRIRRTRPTPKQSGTGQMDKTLTACDSIYLIFKTRFFQLVNSYNYELVLRTSTSAPAALQTKLFDSFEEASRMA